MGLLIEQIKNKIVLLGKEGVFPRASYKEGLVTYNESDSAIPSSCICRERTSDFNVPIRNRQKGQKERTSWTFDLILKFNCEVTSEPFEEELIKNTIITFTIAEALKQITLELTNTSYEHPTQAGGSSHITFSFLATIGAI